VLDKNHFLRRPVLFSKATSFLTALMPGREESFRVSSTMHELQINKKFKRETIRIGLLLILASF
jgi:hypothetical protein